jgi:hypothetical protein
LRRAGFRILLEADDDLGASGRDDREDRVVWIVVAVAEQHARSGLAVITIAEIPANGRACPPGPEVAGHPLDSISTAGAHREFERRFRRAHSRRR